MSQALDGNLADHPVVVLERDRALQRQRIPVAAPDIGEIEALPAGSGLGLEVGEDPSAAAAQGEGADAAFLEAGQVGVGGELGVEDEFAGPGSGAPLPDLGEAQDLVVLGALADVGVGAAEDAGAVVECQEGEHALLAPRALGDAVLFGEGVIRPAGTPRAPEPSARVSPAAMLLAASGPFPASACGRQPAPLRLTATNLFVLSVCVACKQRSPSRPCCTISACLGALSSLF